MNRCPNCGSENIAGSSFCVKCGSRLEFTPPIENQGAYVPPVTVNMNSTQTMSPNPSVNSNVLGAKISIKESFFLLLAVLLKPYTAFKEEIGKFESSKNSFVLAILVSLLATILNVFKSMLGAVRVTTYSFYKGTTTKWVWENLKEIKYFKLILQNFCVFFGILVVIAIIYYLGCLILKKQVSFAKLLGIASASVVPMLLCLLLLAPLGNLVHAYVGTFISFVGAFYTYVILYETVNGEINLTGDVKIYFNTACFSILVFGMYFVFMKFLASTISSGLGSILDMLK